MLRNQYSKMTGSDSSTILKLSRLCPSRFGGIIFEAQSLYRILYQDDTTIFSDTCSTDTTGLASRYFSHLKNEGPKQAYRLFPNPNDGTFNIEQRIPDGNIIKMQVKDILGRSVFQQDVRFLGGKYLLALNDLPKGVYFLQLSDQKQNNQTFKFVIQ